jgi:hypothetical protein
MLAHARKSESAAPLGIRYLNGDGARGHYQTVSLALKISRKQSYWSRHISCPVG